MVGTKWTDTEDQELMSRATGGMKLAEIAVAHRRTDGVKCRIMSNAIKTAKELNIPVQEYAEKIDVPLADIENYRERQEKNSGSKQTPGTLDKNDRVVALLVEIRDYLKIIAEK